MLSRTNPKLDRINLKRSKITLCMSKIIEGHLVLNSNGDDSSEEEFVGDLAVEEVKPALKPPSMYKVMLLNDDYTPMEFVVEILEVFFSMNREKATQVMLVVHTEGKATCGVYTKDVAETKAAQVGQYASESEHPLMCVIEQA